MTDIGSYNEKLVLAMIRASEEGIAQSEVVRRSNLSRQTVSMITRRLLADGLVRTAGRRISGRGKPNTLLRVVADARLTVGVHLDPAEISVVVCDLQAKPLASSTLAAPSADPAADIARIAEEIQALCAQLGAPLPSAVAELGEPGPEGSGPEVPTETDSGSGSEDAPLSRVLLGIGIAAPAPLDSLTGVVQEPPWMPGWRGVPVVAQLEAATGLPAMLDKDTNAALTGEIWAGHLPADETVLYLYLSHGVGSALSVDGTVHRGGSTQAGEIGHLPTGLTDEACHCGRLGCLSLYTDVRDLIEAARSRGVPIPSELEIPGAVQALAAAAEQGDAEARAAISRHTTAIAAALRILSSIHDPQRIIVGGPVWTAFRPREAPRIREELAGWAESRHGILQPSELGNAVGAIGAACLFLERELSPARGVGTEGGQIE
ncbi:ROK family transcriptional regulator [Brachybacterium sp.]|uniref:ROK family transcriptional regulator n=1 Tax=Brachybacterium sp. TaxID=1891286 RepID=UPI002ECFDC3C